MPNIEWEGRYRGTVTSWDVLEAKAPSRAVQISLALELFDVWAADESGEKAWRTIQGGPYHCYGGIYVIGKDGSVSTGNVKRACEALGWSGQMSQVSTTDVPPIEKVQAEVKRDEYKGTVRYRADWIEAFEAPIGGSGSGGSKFAAPEDRISALDAMFGDQLAAIAGTVVTDVQEAPTATDSDVADESEDRSPSGSYGAPADDDGAPAAVEVPF